MSKGLLMITNDGDFINKREEVNTQEKPKNILEGVGYGLKSTLNGIASGVTGLVVKPIQGAKSGGIKGFIKGAYKGASGLVVKPISGALDFFSKTSEGIKNTAGPQQKRVKKIRVMRTFYGKQQLIKIYNQLHAEVQQMLNKVDKGRYQTLTFLDAFLYNDLGERKQKVIILTNELLIVSFSRFKTNLFPQVMDPQHRFVIYEIQSKFVMTIAAQNHVLQVFIVDVSSLKSYSQSQLQQNEDLKEGLRMKLEDDKTFKRDYKILQNYVYHVRTEMSMGKPS